MSELKLFVSVKMPRDGNLVYVPVEEYLKEYYDSDEISVIQEVVNDIMAKRPSKFYTNGSSGRTVWITIDQEGPIPLRMELQLYWRTSAYIP